MGWRYHASMGLFFAVVGFGLAAMLVIETTPPAWRKTIGGLILLSALLAGVASEY